MSLSSISRCVSIVLSRSNREVGEIFGVHDRGGIVDLLVRNSVEVDETGAKHLVASYGFGKALLEEPNVHPFPQA